MRKTKRFISLFLSVCCTLVCLLFASCNATGTYKFNKLTHTEYGATLTIGVDEAYMGVTLSEDFMTVTLNNDNTAIMTTNTSGTLESIVGTWTKGAGSNLIILTFEEENTTATLDGSTLTISENGLNIYLEKETFFSKIFD